MSNEGTLWKVQWKKSGRGYRVFLAEEPKFYASAATIEDAIEGMEERLIEERNDSVPHLEWITPLPEPSGVEGLDFLHILNPHDRAEPDNVEALFQHPRCERCHNHYGPRSAEPIRVSSRPTGDLESTLGYLEKICSARLAEFLHLHEHPDLQLLPIVINGRETTEYVELRATVKREFVAKKDTFTEHGFRCRVCGTEGIMYLPYDAPYFQFVAAASLTQPLPPVFPIGEGYTLTLVISGDLRSQLVRSRVFKGLATSKVGVLPDDLAISPDRYFEAMPAAVR